MSRWTCSECCVHQNMKSVDVFVQQLYLLFGRKDAIGKRTSIDSRIKENIPHPFLSEYQSKITQNSGILECIIYFSHTGWSFRKHTIYYALQTFPDFIQTQIGFRIPNKKKITIDKCKMEIIHANDIQRKRENVHLHLFNSCKDCCNIQRIFSTSLH